ncbi:MAG: ABC transporter ATP-binding protein [Burkholderiales bacterium]|jgi:NitT/TauT family transport system ATP-binding protein
MHSSTDTTHGAGAAPYIRISHVEKTYESRRGPVHALQDIDFAVAKGEFVSILGPSGCGKSTLLKCVAGLESVSGGRIEVAGVGVSQSPENLGIVFQRDVLLDWRTVLDNVLVVAELRGLDPRKFRARAMELLQLFGLEKFADRFPWELSGGMRQRASICRALLVDPGLLLMDEPFGALDAMTRDELNLELRRMWMETHKTILFITHSVTEAVYLSDRIVVMSRNPGRVAEIIEIDLPQHRPLSLRGEPEFSRHTGRIFKMFSSMGILKGD